MRALLLAFSLFLMGELSAQRTCSTITVEAKSTSNNIQYNSATQQDTIADAIVYIPVVVHILYNQPEHNISEAQVLSQIEALNRDFGYTNDNRSSIPLAFQSKATDTRIRFCLARVDPAGRPTTGIIRKFTNVNPFLGNDAMKFSSAGGSDIWNPDHYLNIWVCNLFGRSLGYSSVPGFEREKDGIVIKWDVFGTVGNLRQPYNLGRTATHEVGHWLGLKHIWGDAICATDDIDDTPQQKSYNNGCPSYPRVTDCSINGDGDMFMNYMDLTDDACMSMFTNGQRVKMRSVFAIGGLRNEMLNSFACDSTRATGSPVPQEPEPAPLPVTGMKIYPNPFNSFFTLESSNAELLEPFTVQIYNAQGRLVAQKQMTTEKENIQVNLIPGVYLVKVSGNGMKQSFKMIRM